MSFLDKIRGTRPGGEAMFRPDLFEFLNTQKQHFFDFLATQQLWSISVSSADLIMYAAIIGSAVVCILLLILLLLYLSAFERLLAYALKTALKINFGTSEGRRKDDDGEGGDEYAEKRSKTYNVVGWESGHLYVSNLRFPKSILSLMSMPPIKFDSFVIGHCGKFPSSLFFPIVFFTQCYG